MMDMLPVEQCLPALREALLNTNHAVLVASPGAGKTTRVPLALLHEAWLGNRRIVMLEPRRLAAKAAARYMANALGEQVGQTVGYRIRMETRVGPQTRVEVVTEGVLTRMLQADPALEDVGMIIFDEFHERSLHADLGLALALQSQIILREDLRILVMSATLDTEAVAELLGSAPVISSEGRSFPVETLYLERRTEERLESIVSKTVLTALAKHEGDILVFLPGAGEIRRVADKLRSMQLSSGIRIAPLFGMLSQEAQEAALIPSKPNERKVVLATSIAETSLTVEGIRVVIDCGLMRVPRFSPRTGMTRLETVPVSQASAEQRQGRAGRLAPGTCYRLWSKSEHQQLAAYHSPEIKEADLAPLALELAAWGVIDPSELSWIDPPPAAAYSQARQLLVQLGALDESGLITDHGKQMAALPLHPRLAHMVLQAIPLERGGLACELAAIVSERDFVRFDAAVSDVDLRLRVELIRERQGQQHPGYGVHSNYMIDQSTRRRIILEANQLKKSLHIVASDQNDLEDCGLLLAFAYPDRIAQRKPDGRFLLRNGRGAMLMGVQALAKSAYLAVAELDDLGAEGRILLAAPVEVEQLQQYVRDQIEVYSLIVWDRTVQAVRARQRTQLGSLIIKDTQHANPHTDDVLAAILEGIVAEGIDILPWNRHSRQLQQRVIFMHMHDEGWPNMSDEALVAAYADWLSPHLIGFKSRTELQKLNLSSILEAMLTWEQRRELDEYAPTHMPVPSGSRIPIDYGDPAAPILAVRLQEMFGLKDTPRIARGRVPLMLHLLSPAQRPVQVTRDLANFWLHTYFEVKKDLKGRYPKHHWPDDPINAVPTNRTRPIMNKK